MNRNKTRRKSKRIGVHYQYLSARKENDFDVPKWAALEFLEKLTRELLENEWKVQAMVKTAKGGS